MESTFQQLLLYCSNVMAHFREVLQQRLEPHITRMNYCCRSRLPLSPTRPLSTHLLSAPLVCLVLTLFRCVGIYAPDKQGRRRTINRVIAYCSIGMPLSLTRKEEKKHSTRYTQSKTRLSRTPAFNIVLRWSPFFSSHLRKSASIETVGGTYTSYIQTVSIVPCTDINSYIQNAEYFLRQHDFHRFCPYNIAVKKAAAECRLYQSGVKVSQNRFMLIYNVFYLTVSCLFIMVFYVTVSCLFVTFFYLTVSCLFILSF